MLLKNFELGKLDRRQLFQALATPVAAALYGGALPRMAAKLAAQTAGAGKTFPVKTINHLSYTVPPEYTKVRDFYADLLGMKIVWDDGIKCELDFGNPINGIYVIEGKAGMKPTVGHFAFGIEIKDFLAHKDEMKAEMERRGLANIRPDGEHGWSSDDPNGYPLNTWVPIKDASVFPGAAQPCAEANSAKCKEAYEAGLKNLSSLPRPSGTGFQAIAYSMISLRVPDVAKGKEFYRNALGMKVEADRPDACTLTFGQNTLNLKQGGGPDGKPYVDSFGLLVDKYDHARVKSELDRRGLKPQEVSKTAWRISDPAGFPIEIAGRSSS